MVALRRTHSGFSLLELLIVVALISMICGMSMMRLGGGLAEQELSAAALEMAADLRWMQQVSVNSPVSAGGSFFCMVFDRSGGSYYVREGVQIVKRSFLPGSVSLGNSPPIISFSASGSPASGQTIMLYSRSLGKFRYVIVAAVTGRVRISTTSAWEAGE